MLSYYFVIKTLFTKVIGNIYLGSWNESRLRRPINFKKVRRVMMYMVRITKLILFAYFLLDGNFITGIELRNSWLFTRMYKKPLITELKLSFLLYYEKQRPKYINGEKLGTMGVSKWRKSYGIGGLVRRLGFRYFSSNFDISDNSCVKLRELIDVNKKNIDYINNKLIHIISDLEVLVLAYKIIKSKPSGTISKINAIILDKIDLKWFISISKLIKTGKYNFKLARCIYTSKSGKKTKTSLTISRPRDKVVQQAICFVLHAIYEPTFLNSSHGVRPNKGTHTILKFLKYKFNSVEWCLGTNINNNFPSIFHNILLKILSERISCQKFLTLIKKSTKTGDIGDKKFYESYHGLFHGFVINPILNNIYLHKFDIFMSKLCESFYRGLRRRENPVYRNIQYFMSKVNDPLRIKGLCRDLWKIDSKDSFDPKFKKLIYARYTNDFIVGVIGSRKDTIDIKVKIKCFLGEHLGLALNNQKTQIIHFSKNHIFFLETFIKGNWEKNKQIQVVEVKCIKRKIKITSKVALLAPIKKLFEKATHKGFFKKRGGEFIPTYVGKLINFNYSDILRYYNSVIWGILNYYFFSNNKKSFGSIVYGLKFSCARTLALKYKLRFTSKAFKKFGSILKCSITQKSLCIPFTSKAIKALDLSISLFDSILFNY